MAPALRFALGVLATVVERPSQYGVRHGVIYHPFCLHSLLRFASILALAPT